MCSLEDKTSQEKISWDSLIKELMNENHESCVKHGHCLFPMESPKFADCPMHTGGKNMVLAWSNQRINSQNVSSHKDERNPIEKKQVPIGSVLPPLYFNITR